MPQENAQTLNAFKQGDIAGAWVPEPWATRLVQEGGGKVLVDEADVWPDGQYVTTHLIVRTEFLDKYPGTVKASSRATSTPSRPSRPTRPRPRRRRTQGSAGSRRSRCPKP